ncbi:MAG: aminotransferase class V-fold PLP-dependent enzyme [Anaerolineaceae bacterium]|nr:aminotransferase class V-fold PLP-dependent enzyme [Anaerolineaceae bacterium]
MTTPSQPLRSQYLLDPEVVFLNHGSFGACPLPVFETFQNWQRELERQPVAFLGRRFDDLLRTARESLAAYLNASPDDLVYVSNASEGINRVARSLPLEPGDEILTTSHEYGAMNFTWEYVCQQTGAKYIQHPIPLPVTDPATVVESLWIAVTPRTRVIFISHITSPTALILPVAEVCRRAREAGIWTVIDGAHVPGQIPLDLTALDADFYSGNCHKWLSAPKSAGFLYVRRELQSLIAPSVISWGWQEQYGFVDRHQWQGTSDIAAYLSVPAAIQFQQEHDWDTVRAECYALASETRSRMAELTGLAPIAPDSPDWFAQMVTVPLPDCDVAEVKTRLYDEFRVEVPLVTWDERPFMRVSFQGYNTANDLAQLLDAVQRILY